MARYSRDYDTEQGRWARMDPSRQRGMRPGGYGGHWGGSPGGEGGGEYDFQYGGGGQDRGGQGEDFRGGREPWGRGGGGWQREEMGGRGSGGGEQGGRWGGYGGRGWDSGYGGRDGGYGEGWEEGRGGQQQRHGGQGRGQSRAADIMTEDPQSVTPDTTLSEVAQKMRDLDVGIIPIVESRESRRLRGVITDRDIVVRGMADGKDGTARVSDCMSGQVQSVNKNDSVQDVMRIMRQEQVRRVPVTDREGRLVGIIAQADLAVDYGGSDRERGREVGATLERISEPARPERGGKMAASGREKSSGADEE
jgi:CBS domain-containing protein